MTHVLIRHHHNTHRTIDRYSFMVADTVTLDVASYSGSTEPPPSYHLPERNVLAKNFRPGQNIYLFHVFYNLWTQL